MPSFSGNMKGTNTVQSIVCLNDIPEHVLILRSGVSAHSSSDELFNNTRHTSWGTADLIQGAGAESGYFMNEHSDGSCDCGIYECRVSTVNGQIMLEGTWRYTHGTGKFNGITGNGTFRGKMTSPTEGETTYQGNYLLRSEALAA